MKDSTPTNIEQIRRESIRVTWSDGHISSYEARALRLSCPCALCRDEWSGRMLVDPQKIPDDIQIERVELVGRYALAASYSDGHGTGIYSFEVLRDLCSCSQCRKSESLS